MPAERALTIFGELKMAVRRKTPRVKHMGKSPEFLSGCTLGIAVDFTCDGAAFGSYWFDDHVRAGFPMALRSPWLDARINVDKTPAYSDMPRDVRHTAIFNTMPFLDRLRARYDTFVVRPGPQPYSETVRLGYPGASLVSPKGRRLVDGRLRRNHRGGHSVTRPGTENSACSAWRRASVWESSSS
jgi:hypothetical protein